MNGLPDLAQLQQIAQAEQAAALALTAAVQEAIQRPYTITHHQVCAVAYQDGTLMIGLPSGERVDVPLLADSKRAVLRAIQVDLERADDADYDRDEEAER